MGLMVYGSGFRVQNSRSGFGVQGSECRVDHHRLRLCTGHTEGLGLAWFKVPG